MVKEIRLYIEGGGSDDATKRKLREGFESFLTEIVSEARKRRIGIKLIMRGGRDEALETFLTANVQNPQAFNMLLIDSDRPVTKGPREHVLSLTKKSRRKATFVENQCHLKVQVMEAWFLGDVDALKRFYGKGFLEKHLPASRDVESIDKQKVETSLHDATRGSKSKGTYHKIKHASKLLKLISAAKVRNASEHCKRLFQTLNDSIISSS